MDQWAQFKGQRFLAMETIRRNGTPVVTPLGFVEDGDALLIRTDRESGKVKRIRANPRVRIVPSTGRGEPIGSWVEATATIMDADQSARMRSLIVAKYGMVWRTIEFMRAARALLSGHRPNKWVGIRVIRSDAGSQ